MNSAWKVIGGVIILFAVIIGVFSYKDVIPFLSGTSSERLESLWMRDVISLTGSKALPESFFKVKEVKYTFGSKTAKDWFETLQSPLKENPAGNFRLDVFLDHWAEGKEYGAIIQYQLIDLATNDTVWELGRTLHLGTRDDLVPDRAPPAAAPTAEQTPSPSKTK